MNRLVLSTALVAMMAAAGTVARADDSINCQMATGVHEWLDDAEQASGPLAPVIDQYFTQEARDLQAQYCADPSDSN